MSLEGLVFFDDAVARQFEPFALTRPVCELRAGAELIRRRWEHALGRGSSGIVAADHLVDFEEPGAPPVLTGELPAGTVVVNSRCAPSLAAVSTEADAWRCAGRLAAVRLSAPVAAASLDSLFSTAATNAARVVEARGWWMDAVWDLVRHLAAMLSEDIMHLGVAMSAPTRGSLTTIGAHPVFVEDGATIDPLVVFDSTAGPILVRRGATVHAFSRLVGPCVIGEDTTVNGGHLATCSIGENSRVHGEVSTSIFIGHANKAHEGFIGHSVLGRWVNLGASTVNSNLKNTYGQVSLWTPRGLQATGMQLLGTFFGDHVKTAIGTRLTTGSVIGAGANVVSGTTVPKVVPPFSWGAGGTDVFALDRFLLTAERVMARRNVTLGERARRQLGTAHARRWRETG